LNILTFNQARVGLKQAMDDVCCDHEPAIITRQCGKHVVLLPLKDYKAMEETLYLLGSAENAKRLRESIALHKAGKAIAKEISPNVAEGETTEQG
jgi:antitoxin YefM